MLKDKTPLNRSTNILQHQHFLCQCAVESNSMQCSKHELLMKTNVLIHTFYGTYLKQGENTGENDKQRVLMLRAG